jgi:hypothetical protein
MCLLCCGGSPWRAPQEAKKVEKWPRKHARHEGVERACVVGTTGVKYALGVCPQTGGGLIYLTGLSRGRLADAPVDGNELVSGG